MRINTLNTIGLLIACLFSLNVTAAKLDDKAAIKEAAKKYLISQHMAKEQPMAESLHPELKKRTYWQRADGTEFVMETDYQTMLRVAKTYNTSGDKFPPNPRIEIDVLDIDQKVASVKLTADDWIDYMHLLKTEQGEWKIINVLWQYHNTTKHKSSK